MTKHPTRTVPSDDCAVVIDGIESHPHRGEIVTFAGWFDMNALAIMYAFGDLLDRVIDAEEEEALRLIDESDPLVERFIAVLASCIVEWNWTDDLGKPLPQPHENADAFRALRLDELVYLALLAAPKLPEGRNPVPVSCRKEAVKNE